MTTRKTDIETPEDDIVEIADSSLDDVRGGRKTWPGTVTGKLVGNDTIVGVSNDTLFAGIGDDRTVRLKR